VSPCTGKGVNKAFLLNKLNALEKSPKKDGARMSPKKGADISPKKDDINKY
jgi:hypothetical protein